MQLFLGKSTHLRGSPRQQSPFDHIRLHGSLQLHLSLLSFLFCFFYLGEYSSVHYFESFLTISFSYVSSYNSDTIFQDMLFLDKMLRHLHAISSSWDSFRQSDTFLPKIHQQLRSRGLPAYLAMAACITTLASVLFLSLGRIRHHWDGRIWDVDTTWPQGIIVHSSPRDMAANNTLGVSPTIHKVENSLDISMMNLQCALIVSEATRVGQGSQLAFTRTRSGGEDHKSFD